MGVPKIIYVSYICVALEINKDLIYKYTLRIEARVRVYILVYSAYTVHICSTGPQVHSWQIHALYMYVK